jgi:tetratricopeptide (TPR) repeat protein
LAVWWALRVVAFLLLVGARVQPAAGNGPGPDAGLDALFKRAYELYVAERYAEAVPIAEKYLAIAAARFGDQHPFYALGLGYLGVLYYSLNRLSDAETAFARAMEISARPRQAIDHP